jgi:hypothetical protein
VARVRSGGDEVEGEPPKIRDAAIAEDVGKNIEIDAGTATSGADVASEHDLELFASFVTPHPSDEACMVNCRHGNGNPACPVKAVRQN